MIREKKIYHVLLGYWRNKKNEDSKLPFPKENSLTDMPKKAKFLDWYDSFVKRKTKKKIGFKGWSDCRICGERNGSATYLFVFESDDLAIRLYVPSGYRHYIDKHNVCPPFKFFKCIKKKQYEEATAYLRPIANIDKDGNRILSTDEKIIYLVDDSHKKNIFKWNSAIAELADLDKLEEVAEDDEI